MPKGSEATKLYESEEKAMNETDRERVGNELAEVNLDLRAVKAEKAKVNSAYRVKINQLEERVKVLAQQLKDGKVEINFEVTEEFDDQRLMVDIVRKDNGRKISTRQMTEPEKEAARKRRQTTIPGTDNGIIDDDEIPTDAQRARGKPRGKGSKR